MNREDRRRLALVMIVIGAFMVFTVLLALVPPADPGQDVYIYATRTPRVFDCVAYGLFEVCRVKP